MSGDKLFVSIDFASFEMRIVEQMKRRELIAGIDGMANRLTSGSPTGRMTQCQPVRYLGHTYSSREYKD